ncbi:MAG: glycosyltransferase family 2 protein [Bacteroidales bacterium]|nr:glycosyltransferase family 2 protein [Bacteroidales bacterium]
MKKLISIVIPVYNEAENIEALYDEILSIFTKINYNYEIFFVNDGSNDNSLSILEMIANKDKNVKVISFTRNFGHQAALSAGLYYANGDAVLTMDCDFQDPPSLIPEFIDKWEKGAKIVYGRRIQRNDSFFKKVTASVYYSLLYVAGDIKIKGNIGDFRLIDKVVVEKLNNIKERNKYLRGIIPWFGYKYEIVDYIRPKRIKGSTKFSWLKMARFAMIGILNFSLLPIRLGLFVGIFICSTGFLFFLYLIYRSLFDNQFYKLLEWLAVFNYVLIGILFIFIWIISEYIGKIYDEVRQRPLYVIDKVLNIKINENSHA